MLPPDHRAGDARLGDPLRMDRRRLGDPRFSLVLAACLLLACGGASTPPEAPVPHAPPSESGAPAVPSSEHVEVEGALLSPMPVAVTSFGAAIAGGHLYALGGYHGIPHEYSREGQSRSLWRLPVTPESVAGGRWEEVSHLDAGLQGLALVAHGGEVCRFGGNRIFNAAGEPANMRSVDEAACFSPQTGAWTALRAMPAARSSHEAAVIGETVYIAGGWRLGEGGPDEAAWADDVLALDLNGGSWRSIEAPFRRRAVGVASAAGQLVVIGGLTPEREVSRRVDRLDPQSREWSRGPDFPADAFGVAATGIGDAVYASGRDGVVYRWRLGEEAWERVASLAFPRFFHQLVAVGPDALLAMGGIDGMHTEGRTRHVEQVRWTANGPNLASWTMPYPGSARNRQAVFVYEGSVYLFGGNDSLEQHDFEPENFLSEGWRLHLASMRWERVADYPERRQTMQTWLAGDRGIAVGGFGHDGSAAISHPEAFAYDFERDEWSPTGGLPRGRTQFGLVEHDGRRWIFGGLNYDPAREGSAAFEHVPRVLATPEGDAEAPFEATDVELPGPRRAFAGAALDGRYYLVGGMRGGFALVDDCLAFDFEARRFDPIACPRRARLSAHLVPLEGRLYLVGGSYRAEGGMEADRSVEAYDPESNSWQVVVEELPFDTRHAHVMTYGHRILVVSTHRDDGRIQVTLFDPASAG